MANIFINGFNSKAGGGKSILKNYLKMLSRRKLPDHYFVLTPENQKYIDFACEWVSFVDVPAFYKKIVLFWYVNRYVLPNLLKTYKIDIVFNLSDVVIPTHTKQLFLFDWAYAVFPKSVAWKRMDLKGFVQRRTKLYLFKMYMRYADIVIAQTDVMKSELQSVYSLENVTIVPNAVSLENIDPGCNIDFGLPHGKKLLYITHYYTHKNIEIFIPLAQKIKQLGYEYKLITTIDKKQHAQARRFLYDVKRLGLNSIIHNVGSVRMEHVPSLYRQCDALLMPTLLESFSGTYVEAMFHKIPIITSDFSFAHGVCRDGAFYFDPLDSDDILDKINTVFFDKKLRMNKLQAAQEVLHDFMSWEQVFELFQALLDKMKY